MSAKGRREGGSLPYDYYPTPAWCVDRLLDDCAAGLFEWTCAWLEPTVGDGAIVRACEDWHARHGRRLQGRWDGVELRLGAGAADVCRLFEGEDFRTWEHPQGYDLAIGNPPYALTEGVLRRALLMAERCAFLLRVGFLGSAERAPFWQEHGDVALRVLPDRPSFDGEGTDSATYAWFIWGCPGVTGVKVLEPTPAHIRAAHKPGALEVDPRQAAFAWEAAE